MAVEFSSAFNTYLCTLPWAGAGLDWRGISHRHLRLTGDVPDEDVVGWARHTAAGTHDYILATDSADEPSVLCPFDDGLRDLDLLSHRPDLFICGADLIGGRPSPVYPHFIERRFLEHLRAPDVL
ncbi:hypothetical protein ABN028_23510 [Actinopolymorpha sp. B17G11]|uniref:hypothetical protein n=1 Tax=Actinopolymorpha sp. B17G11 TaxID=3160861 RepID=UPI0032E397FE